MANTRRLKILQVGKFYPPHMGGIETHLEALCNGLSQHMDVQVLVANHGRSTQKSTVRGIPVVRAGTKATIASTPFCPTMPRHLHLMNADLIHIHLPNPTAILSYLVARSTKPVVLTYHSDTVKQKYLYPAYRPFQQRVLARCGAIIATSANYLATSPVLQSNRDRCHVIPYGIPASHFAIPPVKAVSGIREQYGKRIVLAVGRLVYYKGFEYLIQAMKQVDAHLLLIGTGPLLTSLQTVALKYGVTSQVTFVGDKKNEELLPYYHAADVFVLPSIARSEAFGIVQIEAMAAGKPVINTLLDSGVPSVSLDGITGITVEPREPSALAAAINLLLDNSELRLSLGRAARLRALAEFQVETMTTKTLNLYENLYSQKSSLLIRAQSAKVAAGD